MSWDDLPLVDILDAAVDSLLHVLQLFLGLLAGLLVVPRLEEDLLQLRRHLKGRRGVEPVPEPL